MTAPATGSPPGTDEIRGPAGRRATGPLGTQDRRPSDGAAGAVLVTGGGRGLGRVLATGLAKAGFDVVITYRYEPAAAAATVAQIEGHGRRGVALRLAPDDLPSVNSFLAALRAALDKLGYRRLYGLLNTVEIGVTSLFAEPAEDVRDQLLYLHLQATHFFAQEVLPLVEDEARLVHLLSKGGSLPLADVSIRGATPSAVALLGMGLASALADRGISLDLVAAGAPGDAPMLAATSRGSGRGVMAAAFQRLVTALRAPAVELGGLSVSAGG